MYGRCQQHDDILWHHALPCPVTGNVQAERSCRKYKDMNALPEQPTDTIAEAQEELISEFQFFDDWMDRYQYLIDLGRKLPDFPEAWRTEENKVHGCQSQVWLRSKTDSSCMQFQAISDSAIVSGLIAVLMRIYSGRTPEKILETPPDFIAEIGLDSHLSPTRANGLHAMLTTIKARAAEMVGDARA